MAAYVEGTSNTTTGKCPSSVNIDFDAEAQERGMRLLSCTQSENGSVSLCLDLGKNRQFVLSGVPGRGPFNVSTQDPFLLESLFVENLEEIQSQAKRIQEVMSAAAEVHMCISGDGEDGEDDEDGGDEKYEYDYGGMELVMDEDKAKRSTVTQEGGSVFEDTDISKMLAGRRAGGRGNAGDVSAGAKNTRLMRDLSRLVRSDTSKLGFSLQLKDDDALNVWSINLFGFSDCPLAEDMKRLAREKKVDHIRLLMTFKDDYPFSPPFVRVVYPRFRRSTGYIIDGAFCMELLTNQGWTPTNDIESVVVQIRAQMVVGHARIDFGSGSVTQPYSEEKAKEAFKSAAKVHKWAITDP